VIGHYVRVYGAHGRAALIASLALLISACGGTDAQTYRGKSGGVNVSGTTVSIVLADGEEKSLVFGNGVEWRSVDGSWHEDGTPECLPPLSSGANLTVRTTEFAGRERVLQIECGSLPSELVWAGEGAMSPFHAFCAAVSEGTSTPPVLMIDDPCASP
jgi:hypothetical protein